jgi:hypothetical protein
VRPLPLTAETRAVLTRIRTRGWTLFVFGMSPGEAWRLVKARVERRIQDAGVAVQNVNVYRRYLCELAKAFRAQTGEPLPRGGLHQHKVARFTGTRWIRCPHVFRIRSE